MQNKFIVDLYIRVSTDRQAKEGDSLEEQESELKKFCEYRNYQLRNIYIERGKSGSNTNRPEYQKLLTDIHQNKIQAVVVKKIDRLSRSLLDFEAFMVLLQEKNIEFISLKENFDTTNAMGKAMLRVALVFAQLEREQTSERIKDVFEYRASHGLFNGGICPYGYTNVNKELIPYPKERQVVELIFDKFIDLKSTTQVAKFLNETGYRDRNSKLWDKRRIQKILQYKTYIGKTLWNGKHYQGIHQPIISDQKHEEVQIIFDRRRNLKEKSSTKAILQKLLFCGFCGSPMTPSHSLNKIKVRYYYYRCTSTHNAEKGQLKCKYKYVPFKAIEPRFAELLLSLSEQDHFKPVELQINKHNDRIAGKRNDIQNKMLIYEEKLKTTKSKKENYLDTLISSKFLSSERKLINNKINELELEEKQFQAQLYTLQFELTIKLDEFIMLTDLKKILVSFKTNYEIFSHDQVKEFFSANIKEVIYYPDKLSIQFRALPWPIDFANSSTST